MGKIDKKLTKPEAGQPIDHAGKAVTTEPIEGGVLIENCSLPFGHEARVVYREHSPEEKREQKQLAKDAAAFARADAMIFLRLSRDAMLRATDHFEMANGEKVAGGEEEHKAWLAWRQKLRDLPAKTKDPEDVTWPEPPKAISSLIDMRRFFPATDFTPMVR